MPKKSRRGNSAMIRAATKMTRALVDVAMGRKPADLVVRRGTWVCVQSGEIISDTDVAVAGQRIAFVGPDARHCVGPHTRVIDADGRYLVPGLLDGHMHVESSMVTVTEFVRAVLPHGTTGIFIDPHEIANVFGLKGVRLMVEEASKQPIHVWVQMPSCVPAVPGLETSGAMIGPQEVAEAMTWPGIIGLGEMMNFPGVENGDSGMLEEMAITRAAGRTVGGHYASSDLGRSFHGYVAGGAEDDHEGRRVEDAVARARQGLKPMLRYGSAAYDVSAQVAAITQLGLDSRRFLLCTDDSHAQTLAVDGHMDRVIRHAISEGVEPMTAIQMATLNTAEHFSVSRDMGLIAPGRWADMLLVGDLREFKVDLVISKGQVAAEDGVLQARLAQFKYPAWVKRSVRLDRQLAARDFQILSAVSEPVVRAHVIGVVENQLATEHLTLEVGIDHGVFHADEARDIAKLALIKRHAGSKGRTLALVHGFGFEGRCAVASTVAHDSHHLLVAGTDDECMAQAANELKRCGGGQVVVKDRRVVGIVELSIGGLMSTERVGVVAAKTQSLLDGYRACGCRLNSPNVLLSFLALPVIPALRISDKGLVDVNNFKLIPVLEEA